MAAERCKSNQTPDPRSGEEAVTPPQMADRVPPSDSSILYFEQCDADDGGVTGNDGGGGENGRSMGPSLGYFAENSLRN